MRPRNPVELTPVFYRSSGQRVRGQTGMAKLQDGRSFVLKACGSEPIAVGEGQVTRPACFALCD